MPGFVPSALGPSSGTVQPRAGLGMGQAMYHPSQLCRLRWGHHLCCHVHILGATGHFLGAFQGKGVNRCPPGRAANRTELPWVAPEPSSTVPTRWDCDAGLLSWPWQGVRHWGLRVNGRLLCHRSQELAAPRNAPPVLCTAGAEPTCAGRNCSPHGASALSGWGSPCNLLTSKPESAGHWGLGHLLLPVPLHWQPPLALPKLLTWSPGLRLAGRGRQWALLGWP